MLHSPQDDFTATTNVTVPNAELENYAFELLSHLAVAN